LSVNSVISLKHGKIEYTFFPLLLWQLIRRKDWLKFPALLGIEDKVKEIE
jgi:hypothetical protein